MQALYAGAGLNLARDVRMLNAGANIKPDAAAASYLERFISFDGGLAVPVLSMHTTGDGLVIPPNESAYAQVVGSTHNSDMLRQVFVHRAGHCAFTTAETVALFQVLLKRLDTGRWDDSALQPAALNAAALAQGSPANQILGFSFAPSFVTYSPAAYSRPHVKGAPIPA